MPNVILQCPLCRHHVHIDRLGPHLKQFCESLNKPIEVARDEKNVTMKLDLAENREFNIGIFTRVFPIIKEYERGNATLREVQSDLDVESRVPRLAAATTVAKEIRK